MKLDLIEQRTMNCDVCAAETDPEDAFCQECGVSLSWNEPEPETLTTKIVHLQKKVSSRFPKIPSIPGIPKLPTAVPAFIGLALLAGVVTWCVQKIDTSFDTFSEDYISSAALKAHKKHNTTEAAELLLRFHLEHAGKMTAEHLLMLGQYLTIRADEAIQTRDYPTAIKYLKRVANDCPQYAAAQAKLRDLKERGLTVSAPVQPSPVGATTAKDHQTTLVVPQMVTQPVQQDRPSETQKFELPTSIPIWQRFSHGVTTNKTRAIVGGESGSVSSSISGNDGNRAGLGSESRDEKQDSAHSDTGATGANGAEGDGVSIRGSQVGSGSANGREAGSLTQMKNLSSANSNNGISSSPIHSVSSASNQPITENERDKPKVSGFFIDGKPVTHESRSQDPEKSPERVGEATRSAGPKSHLAVGQKSYNPDDISRYNELLANWFSQHDASSQKGPDKHVDGAEPPSFQEWISKGRPGFR